MGVEGVTTLRCASIIRLGRPIDGQVAHLPCDGHGVVSEALVAETRALSGEKDPGQLPPTAATSSPSTDTYQTPAAQTPAAQTPAAQAPTSQPHLQDKPPAG
jgi:hypothetical protein